MITTAELIGRLALGAFLGSIIGFERERRAWTAGLRTHMMVCLGATLMMEVSAYGFYDVIQKGIVLDPSRIAAQVVSGIGFLGAGTIVFLRNEVVKGLTTAAGLWAVAGIGLAVGSGLYIAAIAATLIALLILLLIRRVEEKYFSKNKFKSIKLIMRSGQVETDQIEQILHSGGIRFTEINLSSDTEDGTDEMKIKIQKDFVKDGGSLTVINQLKKIKGVKEVNFLS